jgi:hypothetical protein
MSNQLELFPYLTTRCGRHPGECHLVQASSTGSLWCPRCDGVAPWPLSAEAADSSCLCIVTLKRVHRLT